MEALKKYKKDNSFVQMKHADARIEQAKGRLRKMHENLDSTHLSPYQRKVVLQACQELFDLVQVRDPFQLRGYVLDEIERLADTDLPRYLFYRYRYEIYPARKILDAYPPLVQIEPTSVCNYRCTFCYQTDAYFAEQTKQSAHMSLDLFKNVIDQIQGHCDGLTLASRGEPLICKDIIPMLRYVQGKFLALKLNTNASLLDEAKSHAILEAGMNTLVFSIDAADAKTYAKLRVGGQLDRVMKNIRQFQEIRRKHYPQSKLLTRVSGVKVPGTPEFEKMVEVWGDWVDQVAFVAYNPWENVYVSPVNTVGEACSDLWRRLFVWWDGTINPCDVDFRSTLSDGKMKASSISGTWRSPTYENLREKHLEKQRSACSPCNRCVVV